MEHTLHGVDDLFTPGYGDAPIQEHLRRIHGVHPRTLAHATQAEIVQHHHDLHTSQFSGSSIEVSYEDLDHVVERAQCFKATGPRTGWKLAFTVRELASLLEPYRKKNEKVNAALLLLEEPGRRVYVPDEPAQSSVRAIA